MRQFSAAVSEDIGTIEEVNEPYPVQTGYLKCIPSTGKLTLSNTLLCVFYSIERTFMVVKLILISQHCILQPWHIDLTLKCSRFHKLYGWAS